MDMRKERKDIIAMMYDDPDTALQRTNRFVAELPEEAWPLQLRASVYEAKGDIQKAYNDLDAVIKIKPKEPSPYFKKAIILFNLEKNQQAILELGKVIDIGKRYNFRYFENHSYFLRAFCYCRIGNFDAAKLDLELVDEETNTWTDRLWTKKELVKACLNKRII